MLPEGPVDFGFVLQVANRKNRVLSIESTKIMKKRKRVMRKFRKRAKVVRATDMVVAAGDCDRAIR